MKYAHIIDTKLQGWYDLEIHSVIPTPNIEVTDEVWQEAININANCYEDGEFIVKDFRTEEELLVEANKVKVQEARAYLISTDYVVTKIAEAQALGEDSSVLITQYSEILSKRKEAREFINNNVA